jgi:L-seryl-tRNA(Ser) seleniumtransferase
MSDVRRRIPGVDVLLASEPFARLLGDHPRARIVQAARDVIERVREDLSSESPELADEDVESATWYAARAAELLADRGASSLRRVINATGVVLHTNLGRAPLAAVAAEAMARAAAGYSNLEYDLGAGARGSRYVHCVRLLTELTGADDALVVNNNAAALLLALNTVAAGAGVAVSRGELVEIGGGFRIPEILERSGARLVEVGSTNRTRLADYAAAVEEGGVGALLKVHRSNFRMSGFTEDASLDEMVGLAGEAGVPLLHDLGSGLFVLHEALGLPMEPRAEDSLAAGVDVVAVSGDKLLGGPQVGMLLGTASLIGAMRKNPMCRALRVDKVTLAGLEATLRLYLDPERATREIPVLRMLAMTPEAVTERAESLAAALVEAGVPCTVVESFGAVGGGTYPEVELPSLSVRIDAELSADELAARLRSGDPAVVGRIADGRLRLDPRTVLPGEQETLVRAVAEALSTSGGD